MEDQRYASELHKREKCRDDLNIYLARGKISKEKHKRGMNLIRKNESKWKTWRGTSPRLEITPPTIPEIKYLMDPTMEPCPSGEGMHARHDHTGPFRIQATA